MIGGPSIPVPDHVRSLLVFGGAFDPPHRAHAELPPKARDAAASDWLLYVPAARTPLKDREPGATDEERLEMVRLATRGLERTSVTDLELRRGGVSYTVDTLRSLRAALPAVRSMRLLIGADQAAKFHRWRESREVIRLAEPLVMLRAPAETRANLLAALEPHWTPEELRAWEGRVVELPLQDAASTDVRAAIVAGGVDDPGVQRLLSPEIREFIRSRGLYGSP